MTYFARRERRRRGIEDKQTARYQKAAFIGRRTQIQKERKKSVISRSNPSRLNLVILRNQINREELRKSTKRPVTRTRWCKASMAVRVCS